MNKEEIFEGLKEILHNVKPKIEIEKITVDSSLIGDLAIDSLAMLLLSLAAENKFQMQFDNKVQFTTVGQVVDCIFEAKSRAHL